MMLTRELQQHMLLLILVVLLRKRALKLPTAALPAKRQVIHHHHQQQQYVFVQHSKSTKGTAPQSLMKPARWDNLLSVLGKQTCINNKGCPAQPRGFGSPMGQHSGLTGVSKPSGAELLLCSQVVHRRREAKQGEERM